MQSTQNTEKHLTYNIVILTYLLSTHVVLELWLLLDHFSVEHYWGPAGGLWNMPFLPHHSASEMTKPHQVLNNP